MRPLLTLSLFFFLLSAAMSAGAASQLELDRAKADGLLEQGEEKSAFKAYRELARSGDHDSQYVLSTLYAQGVGTRKDLNEAYGWAVLAAESGLDKLQDYSEELLALTEKPEKARRKARSLLNKYGEEALARRAEQLAVRGAGRRYGSCTGSRLTCRNVDAVGINSVGASGPAPVVTTDGN